MTLSDGIATVTKHAESTPTDGAPGINWLLILKRVTIYARQYLLFESIGRGGGDIAIRGIGDGVEQVAVEVWEDAYGGRNPLPADAVTPDDIVGVLIHRVRNHFLDRVRRQRDGEAVMVWETEGDLEAVVGRPHPDTDAAISAVRWREVREWLLHAARGSRNPLVLMYVELQCRPDDFMGYSRSEAARLLDVDETEITNVKKALQRLLTKFEKERRS